MSIIFKCIKSESSNFKVGNEYRFFETTQGAEMIEGYFSEYKFDVGMKAACSPSGIVIALFE